jgi:hypothetical protein
MRQRTNIIFQKSQTDFLKTITVSFIIQRVSEISILILTSDSSGQEQQNLYVSFFQIVVYLTSSCVNWGFFGMNGPV